MTELIQGTDEWRQARLGMATASRIADVVARTKSGISASRANYAAQLVCERLTGVPQNGYVSAEMQHGTDTEPEARAAYAFQTDNDVTEVGFILHPAIGMSGASPDGLVGADGIVQFKCPNTATHIETLLGKAVQSRYMTQIQWELACTGRQWCDFVSYDNRMPEAMRLFIERVARDDKRIADLETEVVCFLNDVAATVRTLQRLYDPTADITPLLKAG